jgi:uncharacterized membrane protein YgdD (TMEM256/DUF423 family)
MAGRLGSVWLLLGATNGLIAVAAGAYGRHGFGDDFPREMFAIGAEYQMWHALALLAVALLAGRPGMRQGLLLVAGSGFTLGILLFCGSLYWLAAHGAPPVAGSAPLGGVLLMLGWVALIAEALRCFRTAAGRLPPPR